MQWQMKGLDYFDEFTNEKTEVPKIQVSCLRENTSHSEKDPITPVALTQNLSDL